MSEDLKETAKNLIQRKERVKGEVIRVHGETIKEEAGEEGLKKVEERLKEIGCPIEFSKIKPLEWRKEAESALTLLVAKEVLNWDDEKIFYVGWCAPRKSFIIKFLIRYFTSIERVFRDAPKYWRKHVDFGELVPVKIDTQNKFISIRVLNHDFHPVICIYWRGYFTSIAQLSLPKGEVWVEETKCIYRGDEYHQFEINWKNKDE